MFKKFMFILTLTCMSFSLASDVRPIVMNKKLENLKVDKKKLDASNIFL